MFSLVTEGDQKTLLLVVEPFLNAAFSVPLLLFPADGVVKELLVFKFTFVTRSASFKWIYSSVAFKTTVPAVAVIASSFTNQAPSVASLELISPEIIASVAVNLPSLFT